MITTSPSLCLLPSQCLPWGRRFVAQSYITNLLFCQITIRILNFKKHIRLFQAVSWSSVETTRTFWSNVYLVSNFCFTPFLSTFGWQTISRPSRHRAYVLIKRAFCRLSCGKLFLARRHHAYVLIKRAFCQLSYNKLFLAPSFITDFSCFKLKRRMYEKYKI